MPTTIELTVQVTAYVSVVLPEGSTLGHEEIVARLNGDTPPPADITKLIPDPASWVVDLDTATDWEFDSAHN